MGVLRREKFRGRIRWRIYYCFIDAICPIATRCWDFTLETEKLDGACWTPKPEVTRSYSTWANISIFYNDGRWERPKSFDQLRPALDNQGGACLKSLAHAEHWWGIHGGRSKTWWWNSWERYCKMLVSGRRRAVLSTNVAQSTFVPCFDALIFMGSSWIV